MRSLVVPRARTAVASAAALAVVAAGLVFGWAPTAAQAQTGCRVTYAVTGQWQGGFQGAVTVTNLGSPVNGWQLRFGFPATGQSVGHGWGGVWSQTGSLVTVVNEGWNATIATGASVELGFVGSWSTSNPSPTAFTLNGVTCTGQPPTSPPPTTPPTSPPPQQDPWNPPSNLVTGLNQVWAHYEQTYPQLFTFNNYGWDQVMANGGYINYCVRWDSSAPVSATLRDEIHAALARSFKKWMDVMVQNGQGWNGWPTTQVPVKVVGWAVRDRNTLQWSDNSVDIYVNNIRENAPQCSQECGRFFNRGGSYPNCPGGYDHHYDMSLWLTAGFGGGHGGDWGQRMGSEYFVNNRNAENITILLHEIGHSFGLDDFYDWTPSGVCCFIMKAGTSGQITEFDRWMLRDWWRHLKSRYGL
jgi:Cellulose binding domain